MTLIIHPEIEQGSEAWHDQRRGTVTASAVGKLLTLKTMRPADNPESRALVMTLAAERITGWTEPSFTNFDMQRGIDDEPVARQLYHNNYAPVDEVGFMTEDKWGFTIGYSPDGLVGDDGLIEIKSRRAKKQLETILADEVPVENMAQLQCGLLVTGREWIDYISYCAGMPLYRKRVLPNQFWFTGIIDAVAQAEANIVQHVATYRASIDGFIPTERRNELEISIP